MLGVFFTLLASQARAQYTVYTDRNAWIAALTGPFSTENFTDTTLNTGLSFTSNTGQVSITGGQFTDRLTAGKTTTFSFMPAIYAVGGDFNLQPGGKGLGIKFTLNSTNGLVEVAEQIPNTYTGQFFGIVSNLSISSLDLTSGTQTPTAQGQGGQREDYALDNLSYASTPTVSATAVPEPGQVATGVLLSTMMAAGMVRARLRRRA